VGLLEAHAGSGDGPAARQRKLGDFKAAIADTEYEKTTCHLVRIVATRFFSTMLSPLKPFWLLFMPVLLMAPATAPAWGQRPGLSPAPGTRLPEVSSVQQRRYTECMSLARSEPLKALPMAERWQAEGGGLGARHCVAVAMFQSGKYLQAAAQFEAIARDMGQDRPGLRAELWVQAGQAWMEAGQADKAAEAQSRALDLKSDDPDLWIDRGLSYAAMQSWPRAISDFDNALRLRQDDVELLVLRSAAWRNARNPDRALVDANRALAIAPDHSEALLERGFAHLARGSRALANEDFNRVLRLVPPGSSAARRAEAGLRGDLPVPPPASPPASPKAGGKR
jgi:Flp pilus assembly protein TadD